MGPDEAVHPGQDPLLAGHAVDEEDHGGGERDLLADRGRAQDDQEVDRGLLGEGEGALPRQGEPGVHEGDHSDLCFTCLFNFLF